MDRESSYDVSSLPPEAQERLIEELEDEQADLGAEGKEDEFQLSSEMQEAYGAPVADERHNQHSFLNKATFESTDTVKTTFLEPEELGRSLFTVRFLLDLHKIALHDDLDRIASYYLGKVRNITDSGMSNKGFSMNLNVTRKMDSTRERIKANIENLKGGKKVA